MTKTLEARLDKLSNKQLADLYNQVSDRQVSKFADHSTAVKRTLAVLEGAGKDFGTAEDPSGVVTAHPISAEVKSAEREGDDRCIQVLVDKNPKVKGSKSAQRFDIYENGLTVGAYIRMASELGGGRRKAVRDIAWDVAHGFISVA